MRSGVALIATLGLLCSTSRLQAQLVEVLPLGDTIFTINSILERDSADAASETWLTTTNGVIKFEDESKDILWQIPTKVVTKSDIAHKDSQQQGIVNVSQVVALGNTLFFATNRGLRSDDPNSTILESSPLDSGKRVSALSVAGNYLLAGSEAGVSVFSREGFKYRIEVDGWVTSILPLSSSFDETTQLWISTDRGLFFAKIGPPIGPSQVIAERVAEHPNLEFLQDSSSTRRIWFSQTYPDPSGKRQTYQRILGITITDSGGDVVNVTEEVLTESLVTVDLVRERELWITREAPDGSISVEVAHDDPEGLTLESIDIPLLELNVGRPMKIIEDTLQPEGIWLISSKGLFRGRKHDTSSWNHFLIPSREALEPLKIWKGRAGTLWIHDRDGSLLRLHPEANLHFRLGVESLTPVPAGRISLKPIGFNKDLLFVFPPSALQVIDCHYSGLPESSSKTPDKNCRNFQRAVESERGSRDSKLEEWGKALAIRANKVEASRSRVVVNPPNSDPLKPLPGILPPVFAGIADEYGNRRSLDFVVIYVDWKIIAGVVFLIAMMAWPPISGLAFSLLEVVLGTRIATIALRLPLLRWLYLRRYFYGAKKWMDRNAPSVGAMPSRQEFINLTSNLRKGSYSLFSLDGLDQNDTSINIERWALGDGPAIPPQGRLDWIKSKLPIKKRPMPKLIPMRIDISMYSESLVDSDAPVVKRLMSRGSMEKRIAQFVWDHADFLFVISSSRGWEDNDAANSLVRFTQIQSEDPDSRFVFLTSPEQIQHLESILTKHYPQIEIAKIC